ncbi:MAG: hypothetical protein ACI8PT_002628 [Gammaproteobacteria bacterium]
MFDAATRLAIAHESRLACACKRCQAAKLALLPNADLGPALAHHDHGGELSEGLTEIVHRIRTDAARITADWVEHRARKVVSDGEYVEVIAIIATVMAVDGFCHALSLPLHHLPAPREGMPSRRTPTRAKRQLAWVPTLAPGEHDAGATDPYRDVSGIHIHQALSLVPDEAVAFFELDAAQYLPDAALRDYAHEYRELSHAQIEFLAARVSALNQCVY